MLFRFVKFWWHLNICSVWNMECKCQKHLKYWKHFICVMLLSTLTAFSKSKRIGSFWPKRTCILQSVLGCLTQQTWQRTEANRDHQVGKGWRQTGTSKMSRSGKKHKLQQLKLQESSKMHQRRERKMQQRKIRNMQHKMQNTPAAAVRNNLQNH